MTGLFSWRVARRKRTFLLAAVLAAVFIGGAEVAHREFVAASNARTLDGIARSTLLRAEIAIDYAVINLGDLYEKGHVNCSPQSMQARDRAVFSVGTIKDLLVAANGKVCTVSAFSAALQSEFANTSDVVQARNARIGLKATAVGDTPNFAVRWQFTDEVTAMALVNTDALVFDVLPADLREDGEVRLTLTDGKTIGRFAGPFFHKNSDLAVFTAASERYPLAAEIRLPNGLVRDWNHDASTPIIAAVAFLSLLLGYLVARGLIGPEDPAHELDDAFLRNEFIPYFQPSHDLKTGRVVGFEVLARQVKADGTVLSPAAFILAIEQHGRADRLLETLVAETASQMGEVLEHEPSLTFAFNITPAQIIGPDFPEWFGRLLEANGLRPQNVVIEVTERQEVGDQQLANTNVAKLREMGIDVAIDDVGTGHNGLSMLQKLGAGILKIDKMFIDGLMQDERSSILVETLVNVAREYRMRTIAEGVEHDEQLQILRRLGVDEAQGFHLGRPVAAEEAIRELARVRALHMDADLREAPPSSRRSTA